MQEQGHIRKFFLGANTHKGFLSYYEYVVPGIPNSLFILKGGPGSGKSTFLRKIAKEFNDLGYDIELHNCSSDNDSLDGIRIVEFNIAVMDGTAPHITDPKYPAAVDEIINLGEYWNEEKIRESRKEIIKYNNELKRLYSSSYRFLRAAKEVQDDMEALKTYKYDWAGLNKILHEYKSSLLCNMEVIAKQGNTRHLFHSSINSAGLVNYIENALPKNNICHYIKSQNHTVSTKLFESLISDLLIKGYDLEIFHQPLNPEIIETIVIKETNLVISSDVKIQKKATKTINLNCFSNISKTDNYCIEDNKIIFNNLINEAIKRIQKAKTLHDSLEKYYIENMDFYKMAKLKKATIERIKKMCTA